MLVARASSVLTRYVAVKKVAFNAPVKRKVSMNVAPMKFAAPASIAPTSQLFAINPVTTTSLLRNNEFELMYQNKDMENITFDGLIEDLYKQDEVLECIKRTYQPNWKRRKAKHGFLSRNATASGRKINRRRANTGRRISI